MGIYVFNSDVLADMLRSTNCRDFGREVFPASIETHRVQLHLFDGYWEDIGTIRSFFEANLQLAHPNAPYELTAPLAPIYSRPRFLPPTRFDGATVESSLVADGCIIEPGTHIVNSVIGLRCKIGRNVTIRDSIIMGSDSYETAEDLGRHSDLPPVGIGEGALIEKAIIDKNCRIGARAHVVNPGTQGDCEVNEFCSLRDGILVVEKDACLSDGWQADCLNTA
jgi:glucose-1-phosphate adenylyltransferase